nr:SRPBCC family protein [Bradyrhizobium sp. 139]
MATIDSEGEREGCLRTAQAKDGSRQTERRLKIDSGGHFYRYRMESTKMPVLDYVAALKVEDNGDDSSTVVWSAEFKPRSDEAKTTEGIRSFLRSGLDSVATLHGKATVYKATVQLSGAKEHAAKTLVHLPHHGTGSGL